MAVANYHDEHGRYPPPYLPGPDGKPWHSWRVLILPYIEEQKLYDEYIFAEPWNGPNNQRLASRMPRIYAFHGSKASGSTTANYLAVVGVETVWSANKPITSADVIDGLGQSILLIENQGAAIHWMEPRDLLLAEMDLRVNSPGGVSNPYDRPAVAMLDGSVQRLELTLEPAVLRGLLTIRGKEPLDRGGVGGWELLRDGRDRPRREP